MMYIITKGIYIWPAGERERVKNRIAKPLGKPFRTTEFDIALSEFIRQQNRSMNDWVTLELNTSA